METVKVFIRAVRRAGLDFRMSQGFHPQPRLNFATPLPVGTASRDEYAELELIGVTEAALVQTLLNDQLPAGFHIRAVEPLPPGRKRKLARGARFRVEAEDNLFDPSVAATWRSRDYIPITKKSKKGRRRIDLKPLLEDLLVLTPKVIELTLGSGPAGTVRPGLAAQALFDLEPDRLTEIEVTKLQTLFDEA